ncbi:hypothetical protein M885DRAFT_522933 [Pelagophyceae sp. CCMP2097]|nr:hypothetical protein M885DRAFT_522933 [Pelagophyceae sp. CCMP2097]
MAFAGKVALVTGAGKGIGRQVCIELESAGCRVVGVARTRADLDTLGLIFPEGCFWGVVADLASVDHCRRAAAEAYAWHPVDFIVNCAGTNVTQKFLEVTEAAWDSIMNVNVRAAMFVSQTVARHWATEKRSGCAIVNVSSVPSGVSGMPERAAYCASKGALNQLTRVMALELGPLGVRVNTVAPTVTMTDLGRAAWGDAGKAEQMLAHIPLRRFPEPCDVAKPILWLLSDSAAMVHGAFIPVDGGYTAIGAAVVLRAP